MTAIKIDVDRALDAAANEFAKNGFEGASMRNIAKESVTSATALYYHFGSKQDLYQEACDYKYDAFLDAVEQRMGDRAHWTPETLACAMFDEWLIDPTTLMLTGRGIVDARNDRRDWAIGPYYKRMMALIVAAHASALGREMTQDQALAFASLLLGYCTLASLDRRFVIACDHRNEDESYEAYLKDKRTRLIEAVTDQWSGIVRTQDRLSA